MSKEELNDLAELKLAKQKLLDSMYSSMSGLRRLTQGELFHTGHKTTAEAIQYCFDSTAKAVNKLTAAHYKKWPDD